MSNAHVHAARLPVYYMPVHRFGNRWKTFGVKNLYRMLLCCALRLKQAPQKSHDFYSRERKPEDFKEESLERRKDAPQLVQRIDNSWDSRVAHRTPR
jgi:hypothetical protein